MEIKTADEARSIVAPCGDFSLNVVIVRKFTKIIKYFYQDPITKYNLYLQIFKYCKLNFHSDL